MSLPEIDTALFFLINKGLRSSALDAIMPFVTTNGKLLFLPLVVWTFFRERKAAFRVLAVSLVAVALADGSGHMLKDLFERQRPCNVLQDVNLLVGCGRSFSFPSNHAVNAFGFAAVFWIFRRDLVTSFFLLVAALIGFSRIYVGVHYPLDVAAGALIGMTAAYGGVLLFRWAEAICRERSHEEALSFILLIISLFRVHYILTGPLDLSPDEAHYWEWSRRLDLSYYSKGPMIAYLISAGTALFGNTVFGVRIGAVIFSALSSILLYRLGRDLYDERTGLASAVLVQIVPLFSAFGVLFTIDSPFMFFWILSLSLFWQAIKDPVPAEGSRRTAMIWVLLGVSVGLGLLTKYTMAFFPLCALLLLASRKEKRHLLLQPGPYVAFLVSLVVFSPVILWNASHDWVTFRHTAGQAHVAEGFRIEPKYFAEFLGSQLGVITPLLMVMMFVAAGKMRRDEKGSFLFWTSVPVVVFFLLKSIQGKVQANWALTGYASGFIAFSAWYLRDSRLQKRPARYLTGAALLLPLCLTLFMYSPAAQKLPPRLDPTKKVAGWKDLGREAGAVYAGMASEGPAFLFADNYKVASELAFYVRGNPVTYCVNLGRRMNQYDLWPGFEGLLGQNAVYVTDSEREMPEVLAKAFGRYEIRTVTIESRQKKKMKFTIAKCYDFRGLEQRPMEKY